MTTPLPAAPLADAPIRLGRTRLYARRFARNRSAVAGVVIFLLLVAYASIGGLLTRWNFLDQDFLALTQPPGPSHWLGTNQFNDRANRFYAKSGFTRVGTKRFLVGSRYEDDFVWELAL